MILLADYLDALPEGYEHFDMLWYRSDQTILLANEEPFACDTVACALGHAPFAIPGSVSSPREEWDVYADRVFGLNNVQFAYCFCADWVDDDNTVKSAALRIRTLALENLSDDEIRAKMPWDGLV
jgi:hypothetical protein